MSALPDLSLARAALSGTDQDLDRLARAWLPHLYRWCHRFGGPGIDPEDAAHETLIIMCRKLNTIQSPEQFPAWLFSTARGVVANHRRRAWVRRWVPGLPKEPVHPGWSPERTAEAKQAAEQVWNALDRLPRIQREVLVLCQLEERSASEAAALLGVPVGTVKSRLRLARQGFAKAFPIALDRGAVAAEVS